MFNLGETDTEKYWESKTARFIKMITFVMSDRLRSIAIHSIQELAGFFRRYDINRDPITLLFEGISTTLDPVFIVNVELSKGSPLFTPSLQTVQDSVLNVLNDIIEATRGISRVICCIIIIRLILVY